MEIFDAQQDTKSEAQTPHQEEAITVATNQHPVFRPENRWKWWLLVALNIIFLLAGQSAAVLLTKFYFNHGGKSKWLASLTQTIGFPILYLPLLFFRSVNMSPSSLNNISHCLVYFSLGCLLAIDDLLYSIGVEPLSVTTYSLICASQLVFNAIFSFIINSEKLTILILNSIVFITISASMVAVHSDASKDKNGKPPVREQERIIAILSTIGASAGYALMLALTQFSFEKVLKKDTFRVVFEMQIYTSIVATCICVLGLFLSLEFMDLKSEMEKFDKGKASYVASLIGTSLAWQLCTVGVVGLVYLVSSLFSNVVSMLSLPFVPIVGVLFYGEKMDATKVLAMLFTLWGFASYIYQQYLDENRSKENKSDQIEDSRSELNLIDSDDIQ
ncbi:probable purine permease 11 [Hibiscus syriacus]|uniref:probable purine permease 11 n=1 Tax=Hibiscus syriacus TaxID=106335 RepID=UPI00192308F3|nr:probable purine permease 11 [Hibiscus syriacus]